MSADRELIERVKSLTHTFDGEFSTAPHTRRVSEVHLPAADMDRLLALASAGADATEQLKWLTDRVHRGEGNIVFGLTENGDVGVWLHGDKYHDCIAAGDDAGDALDAAAVAARGRG